MRKRILLVFLSCICLLSAEAQYGNEWIDFDKTYYKFKIAQDGIYRIPQAALANAGLGGIPGSQFRLYRLGSEVPVFTSSSGMFSNSDFIEFYGERNRGELDRALFTQPDDHQLNPEYSMFTDSSTYFLTWDVDGTGLRITGIENDLTNPPGAEPYYMHEEEWVYSEHAIDPRNDASGTFISYSRHQEGEGFGTAEISDFVLDIPSSLMAVQGPDARLSVRLSSATYTQHDITVLFNGDTILGSGNTAYSQVYQLQISIPAGSVVNNQILDIKDYAANGRFAMSYVKWTYPRQMDFTGNTTAHFLHAAMGSPQYFELTSFNYGGEDPVIYDRNSGLRLIGTLSGNVLRFLLPAYTGEREIVIASQHDAIHTIEELSERIFTDFSTDNSEYIIITHPSLRSGSDVVNQYAEYRRSMVGGNYNVGVYSIFDLYDQFGYGIEKHPQAIRNFNTMMRDHWDAAKMVLLIGKGIVYTQSRQHGSEAETHLLVPTFGNPGADNLLFTDNGISLPALPVGRLPVSDADQLQIYLSKVIEYDQVIHLPQTIEDRGWTKHILHMGGGADASQQSQILGLLNQMASNAINAEFGAHVSTFTKTSTNATGQSNSDRIIDILNNGVSIVKFFGHSSASTLDFQINNPRDWQNKGKYPIFSAMGCKAGDIHQDYSSLSENFVFEPDAGTIAFVAGSGAQYLSSLGSWGRDWYDTFGHGVNTMTLGETILESLGSLNQFGSLTHVLLIEQQTINGDPALRFYSTPGPDYVWDYQSVTHDPEVLTTNVQSFTLSADVVNIGTNRRDTVLARVEQQFPDGTLKEIYFDTVYLNTFRTSLNFELPVDRKSSGLNTFYVTIDVLNHTEEHPNPAAEENNVLADAEGKQGYDIFLLDNRATTTYPIEFSIVTEHAPELIASSINAFAKGVDFVMELDTTPDFNSGMLMREFFSGFGGVLRWKPIFQFESGKVYYWRVSEAGNPNEYLWDSSSFLYNPDGMRGWNQSHYGQFEKDILQNLDFDRTHSLDFDTVYRNIWVQNKVDLEPTLDDDPVVFINNNLRRDFFTFYQTFDAHVSVVVIDSFSGRFLRNPPGGQYGAVNPTANPIFVFPFNTGNPDGRNNLMTFLTDVVQEGMYVILYTYQRPGYMDYFPETWESDEQVFGRSIFSVVEDLVPGSNIRSIAAKGSVPYLLYYRNNQDLIYEGIANQLEETLSYDYNFISHATSGDLISTLIGPARTWHGLEWNFTYSDNPADDVVHAELIAFSESMTDSLVLDITSVQDTLLEFINADQYPYLYLRFHVEDVPNLTAPYVNFWRVLYEGVPDLFINPAGGFEFEKDTLMIGQTLGLTTSIENLGADMTESYPVRFTITDEQNNIIVLTEDVPALKSGESTSVHISKELSSGAGRNVLLVEVNPDQNMLESSFLNNTGILNFILLADQNNPVLDVTFDGRHIVDRDIVSTRPVIIAELHDDNPFRLLDDKNAFQLFLRYPNDFDYTEIDLDGSAISFEPAANGEQNTARLIFRPSLEDGFYDMIVRAQDRSNNAAGIIDYVISFEVLGDQLLSRVVAEPSLFNDHTRFIFTLSGGDLPSEMSLQIFNVAGQVVREIGKDEIGLFVGTTEYVWNGTTDSGERLPGGVYFYRLYAKDINGQEFDSLGPGFQTHRNARVGKLVIVR